MKKVLTSLFVGLCSLAALATNYTGTLTVDVDGSVNTYNKTISLTQVGSNYNLSILNFSMDDMPIGNIILEGIPATTDFFGVTAMAVNRNIQIEAASDEDMGPMLGFVPIHMVARFKGEYLLVDIDIYMAALMQTIHVNFTSENAATLANELFQLPNNGFEEWSTFGISSNKIVSGTTYNEPKHWHSFGSCTGSYAGTARSIPKCEQDGEDKHSGSYSVKLTTGNAIISKANGSVSSGRFNAGAMKASSTDNNAFMDGSNTDTDINGDKFYMEMPGKADHLSFWMKVTPKSGSPKASMSAIVFNGAHMQDPELSTYDANKVAHAKKTDITGNAWNEYVIPFDYASYASNNAEPNAILLTASTNATPGGGTTGDVIRLDDIQLIYDDVTVSNIVLSGVETNEAFVFDADTHEYNLTYEGEAQSLSDANFNVTLGGGVSGFAVKNVEDLDGGSYKVAIAAVRGDMAQYELYSININRVVSLANALESLESTAVTVSDVLYVTDADWDTMNSVIATDGAGTWIELEFVNMSDFTMVADAPAIAANSAYGYFDNFNVNPTLTLQATPTPDYEAEPFADFATYDLAHAETFQPHPNEVAFVEGYMDNNGKLRGWSGEEGAQGMSLDLDLSRYAGDTNFTKGEHMKFFGVFKLKEAWSGAPRRIAADDPDYFDNLTLVVTDGGENNPTAIDTVATAKTVEAVRYINVAGKQSARPFDGVNIVVTRYTDGTTQVSKVVK